jgi:hypothetical protein
MQALKQAARDGDLSRIEAIRETYSLGTEKEVPGIDSEVANGSESIRLIANMKHIDEVLRAPDAEDSAIERVGS